VKEKKNAVSGKKFSDPVEGRTKIWQLKNLILTLFGLIFRRINININIYIRKTSASRGAQLIFHSYNLLNLWKKKKTQFLAKSSLKLSLSKYCSWVCNCYDGAGHKAKRLVLQCINGVSSNPVEGRTQIWQLKNLILTLFGLIFRRI
jgi:hypothetical protein